MADLAATFRQPFAEQVAAFRLRLGNLVPTARWDDISRAQHDSGFMVAGAVKADLLADLGLAVLRAKVQGTGFEAFKSDFRGIVEKHGWHGWTGEGTPKGEAWRMRVIYRTNMATSYAAGRMAQLVDGQYKYWIYKHGNALEPRLQHLAWDGVALEPDHPFWASHAPPNDWGCTCYIEGARTEAGIKRVGGTVGKPLPDGWAALNPKTGTPVGVGKGWDYAPGASVAREVRRAVTEKITRLPARIGADFASGWSPSTMNMVEEDFSDFVRDTMNDLARGKFRVVGALKPAWVDAATRRGVAPETAEIAVRDQDILHSFRGAKAKRQATLDLDWYKALPKHLRSPQAVILDQTDPGNPAFLLIYNSGPKAAKLVIRINYRTKKAGVLNVVTTGQGVDTSGIRAMIGHGYDLIEGEL